MMKIILAIGLAASTFATTAHAGGCNPGDTMVTEGPHKGQCARNTTKHSYHRNHGSANAVPKTVIGSPAGANVVKITTQHKFEGDVVQFRCSFDEQGNRIRHEGTTAGTGWCHD